MKKLLILALPIVVLYSCKEDSPDPTTISGQVIYRAPEAPAEGLKVILKSNGNNLVFGDKIDSVIIDNSGQFFFMKPNNSKVTSYWLEVIFDGPGSHFFDPVTLSPKYYYSQYPLNPGADYYVVITVNRDTL